MLFHPCMRAHRSAIITRRNTIQTLKCSQKIDPESIRNLSVLCLKVPGGGGHLFEAWNFPPDCHLKVVSMGQAREWVPGYQSIKG